MVLLGEDKVEGVPLTVVLWVTCVIQTWVSRKFPRSGNLQHRLVAWPCCPHRSHGGVIRIVGVSVMMGDFDIW